MGTLTIPRPEADEAATFYHGYIAKVTGEDIGEQLRQQLEDLEQLFKSMDDRAALFRYAPGKWSIKEMLGHLTDAERIFAYRLMRIARGDTGVPARTGEHLGATEGTSGVGMVAEGRSERKADQCGSPAGAVQTRRQLRSTNHLMGDSCVPSFCSY